MKDILHQRRFPTGVLLGALVLASCQSSESEQTISDVSLDSTDASTDASDAAVDSQTEVGQDGSDTSDEETTPAGPCGGTGTTITMVVSRLGFARLVDSTSEGLNLDARTSDFRDPMGCFAPDATSPDGRTGIDNNFATLLPALEQIGGDAIEGLIQAAVNSGELLVFATLEYVDDLENDACVVVTVGRAFGTPDLGTDGRIAPGQTFDYHPEIAPTAAGETSIVDGRIVAGTFDFALPVSILGTNIELTARNASLVLDFTGSDTIPGFLAGGIPLSDVMRIADQIDFGDNTIANVVRDLAPSFADLGPDDNGDCQAISVTLLMGATRGYFYPDSVPAVIAP